MDPVVRAKPINHRSRRAGQAVLEVALIAPWIFLLFMGAFDLGFYYNALISTENAARVAAEYTSTDHTTRADSRGACTYALLELKSMSNAHGLSSCTSLPVIVSASAVTGPDGSSLASSVSVTYQTVPLFPIPGLMGRLKVTRTAVMYMRGS